MNTSIYYPINQSLKYLRIEAGGIVMLQICCAALQISWIQLALGIFSVRLHRNAKKRSDKTDIR